MTFRGAIVSVGGRPDPIVRSLNEAQPAFVLFVVSAGSKPEVEHNILPKLTYAPQYNCAQVPDEGDIAGCYETARVAIPGWLKDRGLQPGEVYVDITGATKPMSAGLAMAAAERFSHFAYVGGKERDRGGLGVVVSGTEEVFRTVNPWDKLAARERDRATWLLQSGQPEQAARCLVDAASKCSPDLSEELRALGELVTAFGEADRFSFAALPHSYNKIRGDLNQIFARRAHPEVFAALDRIAEHWRELRREAPPDSESVAATLRELLANARRCASQHRYDDAIARLYRATELFVQAELQKAFQARLGNVTIENVPAQYHDEFQRRFRAKQGVYRLGIEDGFAALRLSPHAEQHEMAAGYDALKGHLQKRNSSILAHGLRPASEDDFESFWQVVLPVIGVMENTLPHWPSLQF